MVTMKRLLGLATVVSLSLISSQCVADGTAENAKECVFDANYFTPDRYSRSVLVKALVWNADQEHASLLFTDGTLVSVKHWSCTHLGLEAKAFLHPSPQIAEVRDTIQRVATVALEARDYAALEKRIAATEVLSADGLRIDVPGTGYSEFFIAVTRDPDTTIITIKYYMD